MKLFHGIVVSMVSLLLVHATGCTSTNGSVVGRSARERPEWVNESYTEEDASKVYVTYKKTDVYRLDLGIRQAQAAAIAESKPLFLKRVKTEFISLAAEQFDTNGHEMEPAINAAIAALPQDFVVPDAAVAQTYHEEIKTETPEGPRIHYDVYVLLGLPRDFFGETLNMVASNLAKSPDEKSKKLADAMLKSLE